MNQTGTRFPRYALAWLLPFVAVAMWAGPASGAPGKLVVLRATGVVQGGLPVLERHPDEARVVSVLSRGFSGRLLRLFELEQRYLHQTRGLTPEPAYLLLSDQQGGFPRFGFILDGEAKSEVGFVDIQARQRLAGLFGATDQIFPHELAHIIMTHLAGRHESGGANQIHAVGVRTDPETAFSEGFAEHMQVMALDDPEADPATRQLVADAYFPDRAERQVRAYVRELAAFWAPAGAMRSSFPAWFSGAEQVLRYSAVKQNRFAFEPAIPDQLLTPGDPYRAYLVENIVPAGPGSERKSRGRAMATEGAVSTLFWRWATAPSLADVYREASFYRQFDVDRAAVTPGENVYLKLFYAFDRTKPRTAEAAIAGYRMTFPDEAAALDVLVQEVFGGAARAPEATIWLANGDFHVGTTLFDQWRRLPRVHTFDLNAASLADLLGVPGMTRALAARLIAGAPYLSLGDVQRVPGMTAEMMRRFAAMADEMAKLRRGDADEAEELSIRAILLPYLWRLLWWIAAAGIVGAVVRRRIDGVSWLRAGVSGVMAAAVTLLVAYTFPPAPVIVPLLCPVVLFGVPAASWRVARSLWRPPRRRGEAILAGTRVLAAWAGAALPAVVLMGPFF